MPCPKIDNSHSSYNGYWCGMTGNHVERNISSNYCNSSANYEKCPYFGGGRPEPQPEPAPKQETNHSTEQKQDHQRSSDSQFHASQSSHTSVDGGTSGNSGNSSIFDLIFGIPMMLLDSAFKLFLIVVLVVGGILIIGVYIGGSIGIIKSSVNASLTLPEGAQMEDVSLRLVSMDGKNHKETIANLNADGTCSVKTPKGTYEIFLDYGDESFLYSTEKLGIGEELQIEADIDRIFFRTMLLQFCDEKGNILTPDNISITDELGNTSVACKMSNSLYSVYQENSDQKKTFTIVADAYEPAMVTVDLSQYRTCHIDIVLK